ncbi:TspO/MBR family protein [Flavobacterium sp.]|uniref:TspO/MBR family protein n=1 Tax=Flavobacterium sp. TaxID=239 RepID=UPI0026334738|nr:TspO/MBR family protein [Flavobacterium sp.]MDD3004715.1 tryptophan-rich sensory protein [Flavobacterium sp.]
MKLGAKIAILIIICLGIGYASSMVTQNGVTTWYPTIEKPSFNPPNWIFAPVWTLLYICIAVAGGIIWDKIETHPLAKKALLLFTIQLILNTLWSFLFFGLRNPLIALIEIILLLLMIYETYMIFNKINKIAGYLFVPYLLWVSFAMFLNASIWWLNS